MIWTEQHDLLCRKAFLVELYAQKQGSRERGNAWDVISTELNGITEILFNVTKRGVRDRYNILIDNFKKQDSENNKASGTEVVETELGLLLRELVEKQLEVMKNNHWKPKNDVQKKLDFKLWNHLARPGKEMRNHLRKKLQGNPDRLVLIP